jgi:hypothetical protein
MVIALIVMEPGSEWPGHVGDAEDVVAFAHGGEGLLATIEHRLDSIRQRGQHVRVAILACNEAADSVATLQRSAVATVLLRAVTSAGLGRLLLSAGANASVPLRREMLSLVGALSQKIEGTTASVSVRFGGDRTRADDVGPKGLARTHRRPESMTG